MCARYYGRNGRPCAHTGVKYISEISSGGLCGSLDHGCISTNRFAAAIARYPSKGQNQTSLPGFEYATISLCQNNNIAPQRQVWYDGGECLTISSCSTPVGKFCPAV